jgi:hypothetical protein
MGVEVSGMPAHRQDAKADEMYQLYNDGFSLAQVGAAFGVTRQCVYKMFAKRGFALREKKPLPFVMWRGRKYTVRQTGYYARTKGPKTTLQRDVWEDANGPIPPLHDIHHVNGDKSDNRLCNLELLHVSDHGKRHYPGNAGFQAAQFVKGQPGTHYPRRQ